MLTIHEQDEKCETLFNAIKETEAEYIELGETPCKVKTIILM
jgi:hypothetical protein